MCTGSWSPFRWKKFSFPIILQHSLEGIVSREVSESENMPSSCHGCFGVSFSCWPPGALLASVFKGNIGTGRPYCLCHESLLASSALLFSPLNGEIRSGGDWERKRGEKQKLLTVATKTLPPTSGCILVSPLFSFSLLLLFRLCYSQ